MTLGRVTGIMLKTLNVGEKPMQDENEMLTADEVSNIMKVHIRTVRKWVKDGKIAVVEIGSREYRIRRSELNRFISESEHKKK